jgi:kinesin family member 6/9
MQQQQPPPPSNPFFPQFPSTGNAAADEQLAQLYKAREAMRKQLQ